MGYTLEGDEVARAILADGTPNAVEFMPRGYFLMVYGREVIRYDLDGYRYGVVMGEEDVGIGFEDMDLTVDEDGRIWAITDQGIPDCRIPDWGFQTASGHLRESAMC